MGIRSYVVPRQVVTDSNDVELADVRGLNFKDMSIFINRNFENLNALTTAWDHFHELSARDDLGGVLTDSVMVEFVADIILNAPALIVDIIALGADATEDKDIEAIHVWPAHAQVAAVQAIYALTVVDFGGPKKLLGALLNQLRNFTPTTTMDA